MELENSTTTLPSNRFMGWMAITSGSFGLTSFGILMYALTVQVGAPEGHDFRFRVHDAAVIIQFLLIIPVVFKLCELSREHTRENSKSIFILGLGALLFTVLLFVLSFLNVTSEILYMVPQGVFGVWLMVVNKRTSGILSKGLRRLGIVAGLGLLIIGTSLILSIALVDTIVLQGPTPKDYVGPATTANLVVHFILIFGTFMGVTTFPIWSILVGRKFLRDYNEKNLDLI